jgi:uncharacterized protein (TIGR00730 family)
VTRAICTYCASGPVEDSYLELASQVGAGIADRGWGLVWGGGNTSMMGAVARATRRGGGSTVGVIPKALMSRERADRDADELLVTDTMRERKRLMDERSDAFLTLPGGLGTLEELMEVWTSGYLGMHDRPVVLLDPLGHYDGLLSWLQELPPGFVSQQALQHLVITRDVESALQACAEPL